MVMALILQPSLGLGLGGLYVNNGVAHLVFWILIPQLNFHSYTYHFIYLTVFRAARGAVINAEQ